MLELPFPHSENRERVMFGDFGIRVEICIFCLYKAEEYDFGELW
jgi:hypothetical protein